MDPKNQATDQQLPHRSTLNIVEAAPPQAINTNAETPKHVVVQPTIVLATSPGLALIPLSNLSAYVLVEKFGDGRLELAKLEDTPGSRPVGTPPIIMGSPRGVVPQVLTLPNDAPPPQRPTIAPSPIVSKCHNFLKNLLEITKSEVLKKKLRESVQDLVDDKIDEDAFVDKIEKITNALPQPHLSHFLKKSVPDFRRAMFNKELAIDSIRPPTSIVINNSSTSTPAVTPAESPFLAQMRSPTPDANTHNREQSFKATPNNVARTITAASPKQLDTTPKQQTELVEQTIQKNRITLVNDVPISASHQLISTSSPAVVQVKSEPGVTSVQVNTELPVPNLLKRVKTESPTATTTIASPLAARSKVVAKQVLPKIPESTSQVAKKHRVVQKKLSKAAYVEDDEDINDVTSMGGVSLREESRVNLAKNIGTKLRSCTDESSVPLTPLQRKINAIAASHGLDAPDGGVAALVSHALTERIKDFLEKLSVIAEHRTDNKVVKQDDKYEVSQDVKAQLIFLHDVGRVAEKKREEQERELLIKLGRSKLSRSKDEEQIALSRNAKRKYQAELDMARAQQTNDTALQALGARKRIKLVGARPMLVSTRAKWVNVRDMLFLMEQEKRTRRSTALYLAYLK